MLAPGENTPTAVSERPYYGPDWHCGTLPGQCNSQTGQRSAITEFRTYVLGGADFSVVEPQPPHSAQERTTYSRSPDLRSSIRSILTGDI
jgi:hypothetical protein